MTELFQFTLFGLMLGAIYAIAAMGLVLTYTVTGVFNFAHGAVGMLAAFAYYELRVDHGMPTPLAIALVVLVGAPLAGLIVERLMRRFQGVDYATSLVVTVAMTVAFLGIALRAFDPRKTRVVPFLFGSHKITLFDVPISFDRIAHLVVAIVVAFGLRAFLFRTPLGARMRAVVDDRELAHLNGVRSVFVARCSWMIGFALAALGGVLFVAGENLNAIVLTLLVLNAYGAAMVGRLTSLPMTVLGAGVLGLLQELSNVTWLVPKSEWILRFRLAIPGLFLIAAVLLIPSFRLSAGRVVGRDEPAVPTLRRSLLYGLALVVGVAVIANLVTANFATYVVMAMVIATIALSLVAVTGLSGQVSLTQYLFVGLGAFVTGQISGGRTVQGMVLGGLLAAVAGALVALPAVRLRGLHLALSTFGCALVGRELVLGDPKVFGLGGMTIGRPTIFGISLHSDPRFAVWCAIVFAAFAVLLGVLRRSWFGRQLTAVRDSELAAATLGLRVRYAKVAIFAVAGLIAGCAGALYGGLEGAVQGTQFDPVNSLVIVLFAYVGGITTVAGALLAGALFALLNYAQTTYSDLAGLVFVAVGAAAIGLAQQPNGLAGLLLDSARRVIPTWPGRLRRVAREQLPSKVLAAGVIFIVVGLVVGVGASPARAAEASTTLGGFRGSAQADGLHAYYEPKGLLPTGPPVDLGSPDALTTIATGPTTFARAGIADPGDLLANPDTLFSLLSSNYPAGTLPAYPYRISATSGVGEPSAESNPAPGLRARVDVTDTSSHAHATMPGATTPAIATVESVVSDSTTRTDGSTVTVTATTQTSGFDLLRMIHIDSMITDLKATSAGAGTKLSGGTKVSGASFLGQPVTIDGSGIHFDKNDSDVSRSTDLNQVLGAAGIHISLVEPTKAAGGSSGQLSASGLRVDFELSRRTFPILSTLTGMLPPIDNPIPGAPGVEDLIAAANARHLVALSVGGAQVSLEARAAGVFDLPPIPGTDDLVPSLAAGGPTDLSSTGAPAQVGASVLTAAPRRGAAGAAASTLPEGAGLAGLVLLALLLPPLLATRLSGAAATVLAADTSTCEEER